MHSHVSGKAEVARSLSFHRLFRPDFTEIEAIFPLVSPLLLSSLLLSSISSICLFDADRPNPPLDGVTLDANSRSQLANTGLQLVDPALLLAEISPE